MVPTTCLSKKFRWTVRGRTWSSSPSTARTTSKHEGGVPQKSSENKNGPEWSTLLVHQKKNSGGQREEGHGVVHHLQQEHHQST